MQASGIVEVIKANNTKAGITYSFAIGDQWYGTYKTQPTFVEGDYVEFDYSVKGNFQNADTKTIKVTKGEQAAQASDGAAAPAKAFKGASNKDAAIQWQSARNAALALAAIAAELGVLDVGAANAKKEGKFEALQIWVNAQTVEYFEDSQKVSETGENPFVEV